MRSWLLLALLSGPAVACSCVPGSLGFCQSLPDKNNTDHAVFIGKVQEFYPRSPDDMNRLLEQFARTHQDLLKQLQAQSPGVAATRRQAGVPAGNLEWRKQLIESIWGDTLTPTEREQLRTADERELDRLGFDYRRRARFDVLENFSGADGPAFTLYTALDGPACGFDFAEGGTYLVEAYRRPGSDTWQVSSCSRTRSMENATDDLRALRAWKAGQRLPGRISGQIVDRRTARSNESIRIRLLGTGQPRETVSDQRGGFAFENLDPGTYQVQLVEPLGFSRTIDLTRVWCAQVFVPLGP